METFLAFVWAPLLLYGLSIGLALLAECVLRTELPNALLVPTGLVVLVALVMPVYRLGGGSTAAVLVTLPGVIAGFILARRSLSGRLNPGTAGLAALVVFGLYLAPVALSGHWTWPGYNFVNDTASNLLFTDLLSRQGVSLPSDAASTTANIQSTPVNLGYPVGAHGLLATVQPLTGAGLPAVYHPLVSAIAGIAAMAMAQLARAAGLHAIAAAVAGALPLGAVLLYRYALHGSIKEVLVVAFLATGAALAREALDRELSMRMVVLIALCAASLLHVFSAVGAAYALALGLLLLGVALAEGRGLVAVGRLVGVGVAIAVVAVAVNLSDVTSFAKHASDAFAAQGGASTAYLGHLARPIPAIQVAGVWLSPDYRLPVAAENEFENALLIVVFGLLALAGVLIELRRRRPAGLLLLIPTAVIAAALVPILSPYADYSRSALGAGESRVARAWRCLWRGSSSPTHSVIGKPRSRLLSASGRWRTWPTTPKEVVFGLSTSGRSTASTSWATSTSTPPSRPNPRGPLRCATPARYSVATTTWMSSR
jgi:hypothetical protein